MHNKIAATILSIMLCLMPLQVYAALEEQRIPWIKPSIDLHTLLKAHTPTQKTVTPEISSAEAEKQLFHKAFKELKNAEFDKAISLYREFLEAYPDSKRVSACHYWIAEANYLSKDYGAALESYAHVMIYYPSSLEAKQAALKSGITFYSMGNWARSHKSLKHVTSSYPNTVEADKAKKLLKEMSQKGLLAQK